MSRALLWKTAWDALVLGVVLPIAGMALAEPVRAIETYGLIDLYLREREKAENQAKQNPRQIVRSADSVGADASIGFRIVSGLTPLKLADFRAPLQGAGPTPSQSGPGNELTPLEQPTLALRIIAGTRPSAQGRAQTLLVLNNSSVTRDASGRLVDSEVSVDFLEPDGLSYAARVGLSEGFGTASFEPVDMAVTRDSNLVAVAVRGTDTRFDPRTPIPSHVALVDVATAMVSSRINLPDLHRPVSIAVEPNGGSAYVLVVQTDETLSTVVAVAVLAVDLASGRVHGRIEIAGPGSSNVGDLAITPDGALLFAAGPRGIYQIDVQTRTVATVIGGSLSLASRRLAIDPAGTNLYVADVILPQSEANPSRTGIAVIDIATAQVTQLLRVPNAEGGSRQDIAVSGEGRLLQHLDSLSGTWTIFDAIAGVPIEQIDLGGPVFQGAIVEGP